MLNLKSLSFNHNVPKSKNNESNFTIRHFGNFEALNNPDLNCIEVDDVDFSNANWTPDVDGIASFSEDCDAVLGITDANIEELKIYPNPVQDMLTIKSNNAITAYLINISGQKVVSEANGTELTLHLNHLDSGMYFLIMRDDQGITRIEKIIKK